jgi:hypothetical protein
MDLRQCSVSFRHFVSRLEQKQDLTELAARCLQNNAAWEAKREAGRLRKSRKAIAKRKARLDKD